MRRGTNGIGERGNSSKWIFVEKGRKGRFRIVTWNKAGISKVGKLKRYLSNFDIIALQETWLKIENKKGWIKGLDKDYKWVTKAAKTKGDERREGF